MKKPVKKLLIALAVIVGVLALLFVAARWGWRLFGFQACNSPSSLGYEAVTEEDGQLIVSGFVADSASSVVGTMTRFEDGTLYVGVKSNLLLGLVGRYGGFRVEYPADGVERVVAIGGGQERLLWTVDGGDVR